MHFVSNKVNKNWIEEYIEREFAGARNRVEDAEAVVPQQQEDMKHAEIAGLINREPKKTFGEMMVIMTESLSGVGCSDDGEDGENDDDEETQQGKLSEDDKPGWVMGRFTKTVPQRRERFRQKKMNLHELIQPGWEDGADYFNEGDQKYGTSELRVLATVHLEKDDNIAASAATTFSELMEWLDIVPRISQMPQWASRPGSSHSRPD
jgi:hypothetical protein